MAVVLAGALKVGIVTGAADTGTSMELVTSGTAVAESGAAVAQVGMAVVVLALAQVTPKLSTVLLHRCRVPSRGRQPCSEPGPGRWRQPLLRTPR